MPGTAAVWHWQNWAEEACCSLRDWKMVSSALICSPRSGLFVACWVLRVMPVSGCEHTGPLFAGLSRLDLFLSVFLLVSTVLIF